MDRGNVFSLSGSAQRRVRPVALRAPLAIKLVGANLLTLVVFVLVWDVSLPSGLGMGLALLLLAALHLALVMVALRPVRDLEEVASRVWAGDYAARVESSIVADRQVLRIGSMFNQLLDALADDRRRMRDLAAEIIEVGDRERAALAAELHDSTAQRLAALLLHVSLAARECPDPALAARLAEARNTTEAIMDEVRLLAQTVHPRVLDDLGLVAALQKLGRDLSTGSGTRIDINAPPHHMVANLPAGIGSVLFRIAQEALRNALRHGHPRRVELTLVVSEAADAIMLEVHDDGVGFDLDDAWRRRPGMGLFTMRERVSLVDGSFDIRTAPGNGTTVLASIPLPVPAISPTGDSL